MRVFLIACLLALLVALCWPLIAPAQPTHGPGITSGSSSGTGDITDVFNCATGNCSSIEMSSGDFLDMSGATPSNSSGLKLPDATDCSAVTGEGVVCWDSDDNTFTVGDGAANAPVGGDITDVFGCATGDCSSITMGATDFLDMSGATPSNTAGLKLPDATNCSSITGEGVVCWDSDDNELVVGDGATNVTFMTNTGDITDVFGCSSGDCASITMGATDFLDMSGATPGNTAGLKLPDATDCSAATGEGVVCWDSDDNQLVVGDGATVTTFQASSTQTLDQAFDNGKEIDGANSQANAFKIGNGTDYCQIYSGASGPTVECLVNGAAIDHTINIATSRDFIINCDGVDCLTISDTGAVTLGEDLEETKVKNIPLSMCEVDGTHCTHQTDVTVGDFTYRWAVQCADNDAATITCEVPADSAWDEAELSIRMRGAFDSTPDGNIHADVSIKCVSNSETLSTLTFGTEAALDVSNTGYVADDQVITDVTAQNVTGCAEADSVYIQYQIDATGTTATDVGGLNWRWMDVYFAYNDWDNQ